MQEHTILKTVPEFRREEPAFSSEGCVYEAIRSVPNFPVVRVGRRVFIDMARWQEFKRAGGHALPGGWRRQPRNAG